MPDEEAFAIITIVAPANKRSHGTEALHQTKRLVGVEELDDCQRQEDKEADGGK